MNPTTRSDCTFCRTRTIRFSDCDSAGIVFCHQYFVMFNALMEDWIDEGLGVGFRHLMIDRRIGMPTVRLEADFRAVSEMGDQVQLCLAVERMGTRSITLQVLCTGMDGGIRMQMQQVIVTISLADRRAIDIPPDLRSAIEKSIGQAPSS